MNQTFLEEYSNHFAGPWPRSVMVILGSLLSSLLLSFGLYKVGVVDNFQIIAVTNVVAVFVFVTIAVWVKRKKRNQSSFACKK